MACLFPISFCELHCTPSNETLNKVFERLSIWIDETIRCTLAAPKVSVPVKSTEVCLIRTRIRIISGL